MQFQINLNCFCFTPTFLVADVLAILLDRALMGIRIMPIHEPVF
jgi:hypothetical protein